MVVMTEHSWVVMEPGSSSEVVSPAGEGPGSEVVATKAVRGGDSRPKAPHDVAAANAAHRKAVAASKPTKPAAAKSTTESAATAAASAAVAVD
jgi:hypothetical protein